mmetsp:Transcript_33441/g.80861  ORF Transcript_33441/g.80861 Transcript_33441/m.80861 type:complete len:178 (+) Transcript_33441:73-606(+)
MDEPPLHQNPYSIVNITIASRRICCFSTSFVLLATAVACLVVSLIDIVRNGAGVRGAVDCGFYGKPPLLEWVFGSGIAYLTIVVAYFVVKYGLKGGALARFIILLSNLFIFCWAIVGAVSLGRDGKDCETVNLALWRMGYSAVVISFIVCCCGGFVGIDSEEPSELEEGFKEPFLNP